MPNPDPQRLISNPNGPALLVIDTQNDFVRPGAPLASPGGHSIVPVITALAREARRRGFPVVFTPEQYVGAVGEIGGLFGLDVQTTLAPPVRYGSMSGGRR